MEERVEHSARTSPMLLAESLLVDACLFTAVIDVAFDALDALDAFNVF